MRNAVTPGPAFVKQNSEEEDERLQYHQGAFQEIGHSITCHYIVLGL